MEAWVFGLSVLLIVATWGLFVLVSGLRGSP